MHPQPFNYSGPDSKLDMVRYIAAVNYIPFYVFLVFTHVMRWPCWCTKQWENVAHVLHNNRIKFPKDFLAIVLYTNMAAVTSHENRELTSLLRSRLSEYHATLFLSGARCVTSRRTAVFTGASGI